MTPPNDERAAIYQTPAGRASIVNLHRSLRRAGLVLVAFDDRAAEWIPESTIARWKRVP